MICMSRLIKIFQGGGVGYLCDGEGVYGFY